MTKLTSVRTGMLLESGGLSQQLDNIAGLSLTLYRYQCPVDYDGLSSSMSYVSQIGGWEELTRLVPNDNGLDALISTFQPK